MKKVWILAIVLALHVGVLGQVEPKGIIIEPPAPEGLTVRIWVDKPAYAVGEAVRIHFEISKPAYIYIWDIEPTGNVRLIFPNFYEPQNYFPAGTYTIPSPGRGYQFRVRPPTGTEWLQIMAATQAVPGIWGEFSAEVPFPLLGEDPEAWQMRFRVQIQGIIPEPTERAFDFTSFQIVSGPAPGYGTLVVNTTPAFARIYVGGIFRGFSPRTIVLSAGWHDVLIRKDGYQDYLTRVYIMAGRTRTLDVTLTPVLPPNQPPVASFAYSPQWPRPGEWIMFDASGSYDPDGTIVSYQWDFENDGIIDATGRVVYHRFPMAGTYNVRLVVQDNLGAIGQTVQPVEVTPVNQPPVAQFTYSPPNPVAGMPVTFDSTTSYDPDGAIISYAWDLDGDGAIDRTGPVVTWTYFAPGMYSATLYVTDNLGASGQAMQMVPVGVSWPGMPSMGGIPGIYVWGTASWNITVNGASNWTTPHAYRIELRTDGTFVGVETMAGPAPLGLVPEPTPEGWRLVLEGSVVSDRVTYTFQVRRASSIYMDLKLDINGDGVLDRSPGFVRLRQFMVNPPTNPLVVGGPEGYTGPFIPSVNFRIGTALSYTETIKIVFWSTTIGALEGR